jgi:3-methyladenine DNA glycosylase AlkD
MAGGEGVAEAIGAALGRAGDPERAQVEHRYLKSELDHIGVAVPVVRRLVRSIAKGEGVRGRADVVAVAEALWEVPVHEYRLAGVELLVAHAKDLGLEDLELVERLVREARTWALVDPLAIKVAGSIADRESEAAGPVLDRWAADPDFWVRRSALLALLDPLKRGQGDFDRFSAYADAMLDEREFFVRKAIGWVLRETSKGRPELVADWLEPRLGRASGVTFREAVKYLSTDQREALLRERAALATLPA